MICESVRFTEISEQLAANRWGETYPRGRMIGLQNAWRSISGGMMQANENAADGPLHVRHNDLRINTPRTAAAVLGIMTIEAADSFAFIVNLKDYDYVSSDDNIAKGTIIRDAYNIANEYDKAITETIKGASGAVTLHHIVLSDAAQALVEVILIKGDGEDPANVYGHITAYNEHGDSDIFRKPDSDSYIDVSPNTPIPLSRSATTMPMTGALTINALLYNYDSISSDNEIANGKDVFKPAIGKSESQSIRGAYGEISVRVTWT
ncbi:hypothetical protein EKO27_g11651 [Xylaria grammica]|uniref:DUF6598 domain-containing protein n=1 Tax=Xylaria grammica TaxID=363999 RepID=A0A439CMR4_9PEZI|nr:hypothetical protein EKO27_g11651 [Xylaria grammica]